MKPSRFSLDEPAPEEPGMLMTSMIDIIFILLAFFVCVTELKKGTLEVDVPDVPSMETQAEQPADPLVVEVTSENRIYVGGEEVDEKSIDAVLAAAVKDRGGELAVHLSGDREAKNGTMMRVVSHLSRAGITRIEFAVQAGG